MRKIVAQITLMACFLIHKHGHAIPTGTVAHATGTVEVTESCTSSLTIDSPAVTMRSSEVGHGAYFTEASLTKTCAGHSWITYGATDGTGIGVMVDGDGNKANYSLENSVGVEVKSHEGRRYYVSTESFPAGTAMTVFLTFSENGGHGLAQAGHKYTYALEGGQWTE